MRYLLLTIATLLFCSCEVKKEEYCSPKLSLHGQTKITQLFEKATQIKIPGLVAIVANENEILYHQAFGKLNVAQNIPMPKDAIFALASMTKPITSVAVMILCQSGKFKLDDHVSKYIPSFKEKKVIRNLNKDLSYVSTIAQKEMTLRHLLAHTSGLGYSFSNYKVKYLSQKLGKPFEDLPLVHEPGDKWTYGVSTKVLGDLIEKVTDDTLPNFYKREIFSPLGMKDTFYVIPKEKYNRLITHHQRKRGKLVERQNMRAKKEKVATGDGGLHSTAKDYVTFLQMLLGQGSFHEKKILEKKSVELMTQNQIGKLVIEKQSRTKKVYPFPMRAGKDKFGLGFQIKVADEKKDNLRSPGSYSWCGYSNTYFWVDPHKKIAAVLLMQIHPFQDLHCINTYQEFEKLVYKNLEFSLQE